jgi:hypothetical protein
MLPELWRSHAVCVLNPKNRRIGRITDIRVPRVWGFDYRGVWTQSLGNGCRVRSRQLKQRPDGFIGAERTKAGTVNALVVAYYKSPDFKNLEDSTKDHRRRIIERFRSEHGDKPLKGLRREHIKQIMAAKAATPEAANNLIKIPRVMLNYAVELDMIESNPATDIKRYKSRGDGFHHAAPCG